MSMSSATAAEELSDAPAAIAAATSEVVVDALPYIDHGYDEPGVREAVCGLTVINMLCLSIPTRRSSIIKL